jgi:predicted alpha/beta hydrolase family esterase
MKTAVIVHGTPEKEEFYDPKIPSSSNHHWIPWLQKQLIVRDIATHTPEMPKAFAPDYPTWRKEFERFDIDERSILVGHSCGGGFLIRWLTEHPERRFSTVVLVAPWLDPFRRKTTDFFEFEIDPNLSNRAVRFTIFNSDNDMKEVLESARVLKGTLKNVVTREFRNYGHFCLEDLKTEAFPELLQEILDNERLPV